MEKAGALSPAHQVTSWGTWGGDDGGADADGGGGGGVVCRERVEAIHFSAVMEVIFSCWEGN